MVVAKLVKWSLPTPEVPYSNAVICNFLSVHCVEKMKIKKKRQEIDYLLNHYFHIKNNFKGSFTVTIGLERKYLPSVKIQIEIPRG